ncbi:uncharacterized protein LOC128042375 [Gossypium raimondii]|uniref:uncharacterized protein LOC128042375 n=1 Tax=Gossypium raimondii TaxID=29730 RepID=UPI00227D5155|nr:uncharacterized protein LOC128042375 [Gossypium raimondii]XP_052489244.1 uncharacterized protein LOC128042375 [Gossypium raimondii]
MSVAISSTSNTPRNMVITDPRPGSHHMVKVPLRKKKSDARDMSSSFDEAATLLAENIKAVGDQISRSIASEVVVQQKSEEYQKMKEKASKLYSTLWEIEGLTDDQRYRALSKIPDHPTQMIVFFSLPSVARLEWIRRFLSNH